MTRCLALLLAPALLFAEDYTLGPDSQRQPNVPRGTVTKYEWNTSKIFPGTTREYWVYVPAQYDASRPACLTVFQDGGGYVSETGGWRVPIVFDNLIQQRGMPVMIGVFINPGVMLALSPNQQNRYNRSYEYDGVSDRYVRFLLDEILPEVSKKYNISSDPNDRGIAGSSSGGIAAFTAAWHRPDSFHRVLSFVGSYTNLRGGNMYPDLIRKMEPKPLRVFLQDGRNDLNLYSGSWFMANQDMNSALEYAGYETNFAVGTEGHNNKHGGAILPDALRWLWKDYPKPVGHVSKTVERHFITEILDPDSDWELVGQGYKFTEGPAVDRAGNVYFVDASDSKIFRADAQTGKVTLFRGDTGGASGLMFGPDGRLYAAANQRGSIIAYTPDGTESVIVDRTSSNDLAVTSAGAIYFSDPGRHRIWFVDPKGSKRVVHEGNDILFPNGIRLSPDEALLYVADTLSRWVWSFQVQPDGSLANGEPFYHLELPDEVESGPIRSGADGMTVDSEGYLYVATKLGIQICDQPGRVVGIIRKPGKADPSNVVFGGKDLDTLYVTAVDKVYRRHLRRKGIFPSQPVKPPMPRL